MLNLDIQKKIVTNEKYQPIAVQIDYQDWLKIEQQFDVPIPKRPLRSLKSFRESLPKTKLSSIDLIRQIRDEGY
ncbi:hypothetical protein QUF74_05390 [Candidatus Halobeggiatoa sp. HSG11]|nr:hypothetical protein [Candidatus Halobeggiatoa sp. HSG11]